MNATVARASQLGNTNISTSRHMLSGVLPLTLVLAIRRFFVTTLSVLFRLKIWNGNTEQHQTIDTTPSAQTRYNKPGAELADEQILQVHYFVEWRSC